ncbi:heterokaryon incompatibility protein-domain-containing protein [Neurospora hispaniola]|uniref:Heterokaryon incompatibility protein-domain-containing protein n=1 Tax=Neurospora hispaniola TaxID=588809 RepID=A0AAJ0HZN9_9PEZI|nr:heterokaryon incompatibility protein-domain-containing protein [Neurospora hispaniola]
MLIRAREMGGGLLARKIIPDKVNYRLIREWLQLCRSGHVLCDDFREADEIPGFQVIDCTTGNIVSFASLSGSGEQSQTPPEYVTLSYVWGQGLFEGPVKIKHPSNSQQRLSLPTSLPLTISDTIQVVQRLGYRYLWIDRYCIPQDDLPAKQIQVKNMGRIYSRSVLTIITAAGDGPEYGLPGVSERRRAEQLTVQVGAAAAGKGISLALYERPRAAIMDSKWHTRGWTYQEGLLSRRRLVFTDQMVYFQCYEMHGDEVLSLPIPDGPSGGHGSDVKDGDKFDEIRCLSLDDEESNFGFIFPRRITDWSNPDTVWDRIKEFCQRQLSFDADTLDAVAGIFDKYVDMYTADQSNNHKGDGISFFYGMPIAPFHLKGNGSNQQRLWTCELRTFWETYENMPPGKTDSNPKLPLEVEVDVTTSLTYRLVESLLWSDSWSHFRKFDSDPLQLLQKRSHFRRPGFPSWAWAGWKTCIVERDILYSKMFDSRTKVHVEYELEADPSLAHTPKATTWRRLDWERDNKEILELAQIAAHKIPARLVIRGTVLDMRLTWCDGEENNEDWWRKFGKWTVTWPQFMEGRSIDFPRGLLEDAEPGSHFSKGKEVQALALILAGRALYGKPDGFLLALLLRPVTRMLDGRPETMYERVHKIRIYVKYPKYKAKWTPLAELLREMEVRTGANQGIGYETAKNLVHSSADYHVILGSRNISKGKAAVQALLQAEVGTGVKATKGTASSVPLDVTDEASIAAAVERVAADFGRLDVLTLRRVLETNVVGALAVTEAFLDLLRMASEHRPPRLVFYSARLKPEGILVIDADPGLCATNFTGDAASLRNRGAAEPADGGNRVATVVKGEKDVDAGKVVGVYGVSPW